MFRITIILLSVFLLFGCDTGAKDDQSTQSSDKDAPMASPDKSDNHQEHDHEGHSHSLVNGDNQYREFEPQDACPKPIVIEFFAYQCPVCYRFEPQVKQWVAEKPSDVDFKAVPTTLGREQFLPLIAAHHVAKQLDVLSSTKDNIFALVHEQQGNGNLIDILVNAGADRAEAEKMLQNSDNLNNVISTDLELMKRYQVTSVPSLLINYQYMVDIASAGGDDKVFPLVDELLKAPAKCKELN